MNRDKFIDEYNKILDFQNDSDMHQEINNNKLNDLISKFTNMYNQIYRGDIDIEMPILHLKDYFYSKSFKQVALNKQINIAINYFKTKGKDITYLLKLKDFISKKENKKIIQTNYKKLLPKKEIMLSPSEKSFIGWIPKNEKDITKKEKGLLFIGNNNIYIKKGLKGYYFKKLNYSWAFEKSAIEGKILYYYRQKDIHELLNECIKIKADFDKQVADLDAQYETEFYDIITAYKI
jgi:hypothetical protein